MKALRKEKRRLRTGDDGTALVADQTVAGFGQVDAVPGDEIAVIPPLKKMAAHINQRQVQFVCKADKHPTRMKPKLL